MAYAWIIDVDANPDTTYPEATNCNARGTMGPRRAPQALCDLLAQGSGEAFKMYDDDGGLLYEGRIVGNYDGFEPLDDFGAPNAGATEIRYKKNGTFQTL